MNIYIFKKKNNKRINCLLVCLPNIFRIEKRRENLFFSIFIYIKIPNFNLHFFATPLALFDAVEVVVEFDLFFFAETDDDDGELASTESHSSSLVVALFVNNCNSKERKTVKFFLKSFFVTCEDG